MAQEQNYNDGQSQAEIIGRIRSNLTEGLNIIGGDALITSNSLSQIKAKADEIRGAIEGLDGSESDRVDVLFKQLGVEEFKKLIEFIGTSELEGICKPAEHRGSFLRSGIAEKLVSKLRTEIGGGSLSAFLDEIHPNLNRFIGRLPDDDKSLNKNAGRAALNEGIKFIRNVDFKIISGIAEFSITLNPRWGKYIEEKKHNQRTQMMKFVTSKIHEAESLDDIMQILVDAIEVTKKHHKNLSGHYTSWLGTTSRLVKELKQRKNEIITIIKEHGFEVEEKSPRNMAVLDAEGYPGAGDVCKKLKITIPRQISSPMIEADSSPQPLKASSTDVEVDTQRVRLNSSTTTFPSSSASTVSQPLETEDKGVQAGTQVRLDLHTTTSSPYSAGASPKTKALSQDIQKPLEAHGESNSLSKEAQGLVGRHEEIDKEVIDTDESDPLLDSVHKVAEVVFQDHQRTQKGRDSKGNDSLVSKGINIWQARIDDANKARSPHFEQRRSPSDFQLYSAEGAGLFARQKNKFNGGSDEDVSKPMVQMKM